MADRVADVSSARAVWICAIACAISVLSFLGFHYCMPETFSSGWGVNPEGAAHFRDAFHLPIRSVDAAIFRQGFLVLLSIMAVAYLGLLANCMAAAAVPMARIARLARALS